MSNSTFTSSNCSMTSSSSVASVKITKQFNSLPFSISNILSNNKSVKSENAYDENDEEINSLMNKKSKSAKKSKGIESRSASPCFTKETNAEDQNVDYQDLNAYEYDDQEEGEIEDEDIEENNLDDDEEEGEEEEYSENDGLIEQHFLDSFLLFSIINCLLIFEGNDSKELGSSSLNNTNSNNEMLMNFYLNSGLGSQTNSNQMVWALQNVN